ncbi:GAF and ANTAR domain-containing protein [Plantactinospora siamensis]|uniref:GAF and ANTAR domain-containing protein n=1 Tax=Plantactinospora siamensis TaxID=555372 RepID=A0ABV6NTV7_9ACTN
MPTAAPDHRGEPSTLFHGDAGKLDEMAVRLGDLARTLEDAADLQTTLDGIVRAAVEMVPGADHAGIMQVRRRRELTTSAATGELVVAVDRVQYRTGQGPCLEALYQHRTVRLPDGRLERRWPAFVAGLDEHGIGSMLSCQLYVHRDDLGALNLYAEQPKSFTDESEQIALLFAAHASVALATATRMAQLGQALDSRDIIGQAKGILMERHRVTSDRAFAMLVRVSQDLNVKLADVAHHLVKTGELDGGRPPAPRTGAA